MRLLAASGAAICAGISVAAVLYARSRSALKRRLLSTEQVEIADAQPGVVELVGRAWALEPASCPVYDVPAVAWRWKLRRPGKNVPVDLATFEHVAPFVLDDGTGRVLVLPVPRELDLPERRFHAKKGATRDPIAALCAEADVAGPSWLNRRWLDGATLREGGTLYVHGDAHPIDEGEAQGRAEGATLVLEGALVVSPRGEDELVNEQETDVILAWVIAGILGLVAVTLAAAALVGVDALL